MPTLRTLAAAFPLLWFAAFASAQEQPAAEAPPAAAPAEQSAEPPKPAFEIPTTLYARVVDPKIAIELNLAAEQVAQAKAILEQRDAALAQAPEADRQAVLNDADSQIQKLLTDDQRAHLAAIDRDEKLRLKFSFRFQPWADVLSWFAEQSDLSLVLDAPPPGTFNYSDTREYTVPEAIDLLNGVLLSKGYTLLRRERMLMLVDLQNGLPTDLVPRVEIAELPRRGKHEMVSVVFPLEDRNPDEVKAEIEPLIGAHGKVAVLPKTKQVLVTDTAGKMRGIEAVIKSIPQPNRDQPRPNEPPKAELAVFPLEKLDPKPTLEILGVLLGDVKIVHDAKANQLLAQVDPDKKAKIEAVLAQLRAGGPSDTSPRIERHPVVAGSERELVALFRHTLPDAFVRHDEERGDLVAWATPEQHQEIREGIQQLGHSGTAASDRQLEVYALEMADTTTLLPVLQKMVPNARLAIDAASRSLLVLASPEEQRALKGALEQLERKSDQRTLEVYPLTAQERKRAQAVLAALQKDLPSLEIVADATNSNLSVWATPEGHARVAKVLEQVAKSAESNSDLQIVSYPITVADPASVLSVLQTLLPDVKFVPDAKAKQIVAWASAEDHQTIKQTVEQLDGNLSDGQRLQLMSHPVGEAAPDALITMLRTILPDVQVVNDAKNTSLVAWARKSDQEVIRRAIEQAQPTTPDSDRSQLVVYPVADADPPQVAAMLATIFPTARFTGDRAAAKLVAWATPKEHESIKATVEGLGRDLTSVVYRPKSADVATLVGDLRALVPEARLAADAKNGVVVAWAAEKDHAKIRATIDGLDAEAGADGGRKVAVYQAPDTDASTLMLALQAAVPDAKFTPDVKAGSVIAFARPEQHEVLAQAVDAIGKTEASANKRVAKVYRFQTSDANAAAQVLRYVVPYAYLAVDTRVGSLAATATPAEHAQIQKMIDEMEGQGAAAGDLELKVYEINSTEPSAVLSMLRDLFAQRPEVRLSVDSTSGKLAAWALPQQHATIKEVIEGVDGDAGEFDDRQIEVYPLGDADPDGVARTLNAMFQRERNVRIVPDDDGGFVTVWGNPQVQASAKAVIAQMQGHKENVAVISLEVVDPYTALTTIEKLFGDRRGRDRAGVPRVDVDPDGRQLLVRASKEQVQQIRDMLAEMGEPKIDATASARAPGDSRTRVIPISERSLIAALEEIQRVWPNLRDNPIRFVNPSAVAPTVRADREERLASPTDPNGASEEDTEEESAPPDESSDERQGPLPEDSDADGCQDEGQPTEEAPAELPEAPLPADEPPSVEPAPESDHGDEAGRKPAIVIAPSRDSVTISSDDPAALDQFEQLLKSFMKRNATGGREFAIFYLKRANAVNVADTIQNVLVGGGFGYRGYGGTTVVPDQRLNAVIVQASRNEMEMIDNLIHTLDSEELPESATGQKPKLIPVKNTDVERVAEIVREVYKTRLTAGGARQQLPLPQRMPREMAALMQQLNSATTGPEMTLGVDSATNSLVVSAPPALLAEVEDLVKTLDEQSNASKPTVRVIALKRVNTTALGRALDELIRENSRRRRGGN